MYQITQEEIVSCSHYIFTFPDQICLLFRLQLIQGFFLSLLRILELGLMKGLLATINVIDV